jgi:NitT/TauT family transport system permease protein
VTSPLRYVIMISSAHIETQRFFSAIFASAAAGIVLFYIVAAAERMVVFWQEGSSE